VEKKPNEIHSAFHTVCGENVVDGTTELWWESFIPEVEVCWQRWMAYLWSSSTGCRKKTNTKHEEIVYDANMSATSVFRKFWHV